MRAGDVGGHDLDLQDWTTSTLAQRLDRLLEIAGCSQNKLAQAAGLDGAVISGMRARGGGRTGGYVATLLALAEAHRVSFAWLAAGIGQPEDRPGAAAPAAITADNSDRWPHRAVAARLCRDAGVDAAAVASVLGDDLEEAEDPPVLWWVDRMRLRALLMRSADAHVGPRERRRDDPPDSAVATAHHLRAVRK